MFTLALNSDGDIMFDENMVLQTVSDRDMWVQTLISLMQTRRGEYFLNTREGLDFEPFFQKMLDENAVANALTAVGKQVKDFLRYRIINFDYDIPRRKLNLILDIMFKDGENITLDRTVTI
jgi:hypothetical protein